MNINKMLGLGLCVLGVGCATPAIAGIVNVTYTGVVRYGYDDLGLFGPAGLFLRDKQYSAQFTFDTEAGGNSVSTGTQNYSFGGSSLGTASPNLGASLTINDMTFSFVGDYYGNITGTNNGIFSGVYEEAHSSDGARLYNIANYSGDLYPASITSSYSGILDQNGYTSYTDGLFQIGSENLLLTPLAIAISPIPEPKTYAMILVGLGLLGFLSRKRITA